MFQSGLNLNYNARTFTIPTPTSPTTYYVTIADPTLIGDKGTGTTLTATCQTSNALVGAPGNIYIGSILAIPGGGGETAQVRTDLYRDINGLGARVRTNEDNAGRRYHNLSMAVIIVSPAPKEAEISKLLREGS